MGNSTNPAEIYDGTTWELLPNDKFLKTGSTPLTQAGSNSISVSKANLPAEKLQVEPFSLTRGTMDITGGFVGGSGNSYTHGAFLYEKTVPSREFITGEQNDPYTSFVASRTWTGTTSSASPYTSAMGSGTPISVNPEHITVKAWKRLS